MTRAPDGPSLQQLPLVTLYLTERCNSRCVTCDYWRHGRTDISLDVVGACCRACVNCKPGWR